ncbi:radical SAM protein [Anaerofustis sp. NSJ-163]|uniref:SPL family radical SAM protein n=1 Tax=Anaerofustis sp. NSJ-163 TaxID=2944391 RepID=UPI00209C4E44|nr:radical SAM protein [Anaerofustis sp. NSJ-163]MCO8192912.1 radical SAM protein [Anaerofustis sp. NSJ-163]
MKINEIKCKTAINKLSKSRLPYSLDLNIYRGCSHKCSYCYALYSNSYLGSTDFFNDIFVKKNILEVLEKELRKKKDDKIINMGSVTDSYQPLEEKYGLMREVLKLMIKYNQPITISTKSDLILRDIDLIEKLSKKTYVNIASTITVMDEKIRKLIEPYSKSSIQRINMLKEIGKTNANTAIHMMPIIPYITDSIDNIDKIFYLGKQINVDYILTGSLNLRGQTRSYFLNFIRKNFSEEYKKIEKLYESSSTLNKEYLTNLNKKIYFIRKKYNISSNYMKKINEHYNNIEQLRLF